MQEVDYNTGFVNVIKITIVFAGIWRKKYSDNIIPVGDVLFTT